VLRPAEGGEKTTKKTVRDKVHEGEKKGRHEFGDEGRERGSKLVREGEVSFSSWTKRTLENRLDGDREGEDGRYLHEVAGYTPKRKRRGMTERRS